MVNYIQRNSSWNKAMSASKLTEVEGGRLDGKAPYLNPSKRRYFNLVVSVNVIVDSFTSVDVAEIGSHRGNVINSHS